MKVRKFSVVLCLLVLAVAYVAYRKQFQISAKIWHWRHGYSAKFDDYEVPIPEHWLLQNQSRTSMLMINTLPASFPRDRKFHSTAVVSIDIPLLKHRYTPAEMEFWLSRKRQDLERTGVVAEQKTLRIAEEPVTCIGGKELRSVMSQEGKFPDTDTVSLQCRTARGLNIMLIGEPADLEALYSLVSNIRLQ